MLGSLLGVTLVFGGAAISAVGMVRFRRTELEIDTRTYRPALLASVALTVAVVIGAIALATYLLVTPLLP
jgi:uncharacterized membrane protein YidH (DUF202 family)